MARKAFPFLFFLYFFVSLTAASVAGAQSKYSETIAALQVAYDNEMQAHLNYLAYAQKAKSENYPNMAYLFSSFAASEWIHARNFKKALLDLGVQVKEIPKLEVKVSSTKRNLRSGIDFEIADIDERYPQFLEKINPEKQHRDLLQKMQSGTGIFFGVLAKKIEETSVEYFVCQVCGSTVIELPQEGCSICKVPLSQYKVVERMK